MATEYARGFKAQAEDIAEEVRRELRIGLFQKLDPFVLANHLEIPIVSFGDLARMVLVDDMEAIIPAIANLKGDSAVSAITVSAGTERVILHNDSHERERQASNLCHELAHSLLLHPPAPPLMASGERDFQNDIENEAAYLGGALLIPGKAARGALTRRASPEQVAREYGTSVELARWRTNVSGRPYKRPN